MEAAASTPGSTNQAPRPVTAEQRVIALYFEDFGTNVGNLARAKNAGRRFIQEGLEEGDRVARFSTSGDFVDYTNDAAALIAAIDRRHSPASRAQVQVQPDVS